MEIWSYEQIPISKSPNKPGLKCFLTYKKTKYNIYLGCAGGWVYNSLTKKCYKDFDEALTWDAARASCQAQINGDLASVPDEATNEFLKDKFTQGWIGGHLDSNGDWAWSDGTPWGYTSWSSGNPSRFSAVKRSIGSTTGCTITEKAPTRAFFWLKAPTSALST